MRFENQEWLLCLIAIPILAFVAWLAWKTRGKRWKKLVAPRLQRRLSHVRSPWIYFASLGLALVGLGGLIVAFAQPESGEEWIEVESEGRNILFCIDISRSMLAKDIKPSRLQASRAAALEILERFPQDRVGVLLFSGETLVQSPLTLDHSFVEQTLAQLDPEDIPYGGTNLSGGVNAGIQLLTQTGQKSNIMVIFSDGEKSTEGLETAADSAASEGIFIYALGMGTSNGSFIPDAKERDGKFRGRNGNPVFSRLDEASLKILAGRTNGYYSQGIGGEFLGKLDSALEEMDRFREEGKHQRVAKPAYKWFLFGGLLLLMLSIFVRCLPLRSFTAAAVFIFTLPQVDAGLINDGREALKRGDQLEAHQLFREAAKETSGERAARLHLAAGSAAYRAKSWNAAAGSFSQALESDDPALQQNAHYALATSLFYLGVPLDGEERKTAWRGAEKHYQAALEINPEDKPSIDNLRSVQNLLKEQEQKDQQKKQESKDDESKEDQKKQDQEKEESQEKNSQKNEPTEPPEDNEDGDKPEDSPPNEGKNKENPENNQEKQGEDGEPKEEGGEMPEGEQQGQPKQEPGESKEVNKPDHKNETQKESAQLKESEAPKNESKEERARRLLKQYADFGAKAPRRIRRPFNRSAHDW